MGVHILNGSMLSRRRSVYFGDAGCFSPFGLEATFRPIQP